MNLRRKYLSAALAVGAATAMIVPLQAAVAQSSPPDPYFNFSVGPQAKILTRGAALRVPISVTCFPETFNYGINIFVTQRVSGGRIASGSGYVNGPLNCDGFPHVVDTTLIANQNAFKVGTALSTADAYACTPLQCNSFQEQKEITIKK
jgi:hypothetical protein